MLSSITLDKSLTEESKEIREWFKNYALIGNIEIFDRALTWNHLFTNHALDHEKYIKNLFFQSDDFLFDLLNAKDQSHCSFFASYLRFYDNINEMIILILAKLNEKQLQTLFCQKLVYRGLTRGTINQTYSTPALNLILNKVSSKHFYLLLEKLTKNAKISKEHEEIFVNFILKNLKNPSQFFKCNEIAELYLQILSDISLDKSLEIFNQINLDFVLYVSKDEKLTSLYITLLTKLMENLSAKNVLELLILRNEDSQEMLAHLIVKQTKNMLAYLELMRNCVHKVNKEKINCGSLFFTTQTSDSCNMGMLIAKKSDQAVLSAYFDLFNLLNIDDENIQTLFAKRNKAKQTIFDIILETRDPAKMLTAILSGYLPETYNKKFGQYNKSIMKYILTLRIRESLIEMIEDDKTQLSEIVNIPSIKKGWFSEKESAYHYYYSDISDIKQPLPVKQKTIATTSFIMESIETSHVGDENNIVSNLYPRKQDYMSKSEQNDLPPSYEQHISNIHIMDRNYHSNHEVLPLAKPIIKDGHADLIDFSSAPKQEELESFGDLYDDLPKVSSSNIFSRPNSYAENTEKPKVAMRHN